MARGRRAEQQAAILLRLQGFEILGRNVRTASGEIDIVARDGGVLVIVEVRYRATHILAAGDSLRRRKRESILRAAREAQAALRIPRGVPVRFDVVLMVPGRMPVHLRGALHRPGPYPDSGS